MANDENVNKVVYGNTTLIDLTDDSVEASNLLEGETAHDRSGTRITGTAKQGHILWNRIKTALTQRTKLWFKDATVSDVSADGASAVEVVTPVTESAFDNLPTDGTADGFYFITDEDEQPLTADDIPYDSNTSVGDRIDELLTAKVHKLTLTKTTDVNGRAYLSPEVPADAYGVTVRTEGTSFYVTLPPYKVHVGGGTYYFMTRVLNDVGLTAVASTEVDLIVSYFQ